jgi:hypothetical protein
MLIFCCLLLPLLAGCAVLDRLGTSSQVSPSTLGLDVQVEQLRHNAEGYDVYYSGPSFNPSAILFVVQEQDQLELQLDEGWKKVLPGPELEDLFWRIEMDRPSRAKLRAVVPPEEKLHSAKNVLAYIYSPAYASMRRVNQHTYYLQAVAEQYNPLYHDDGILVDPGIRW